MPKMIKFFQKYTGLILLVFLALFVGLPSCGTLALRHGKQSQAFWLFMAWAVMLLLIAWRLIYIRGKNRKLEALEQEAKQQEMEKWKREGLRPREGSDQVVSHSAWKSEWNGPQYGEIYWVDGEQRELLADDVVLKWGWRTGPSCGRGGFAIERAGKIIAQATTWKA